MKASRRAKLGRPPVLVGDKLDALCDLLAAGVVDVGEAARELKVSRATVYNTINRAETGDDPGGRIAAARDAGRRVRRDARHGTEGCYTHLGCRLPQCVAAATEARQLRRTAAADTTVDMPAVLTPVPAVPIPLAPPATGSTAAALYAALAQPLADAS